jgi:cytidylate kinase
MRHADRVKAFVEAERQERAARRQELLRDYGREVPQETERDAAIERDQRNQHDRGRGGRER